MFDDTLNKNLGDLEWLQKVPDNLPDEKLLGRMKENRPERLEKCRYFLTDRRYDSIDLIEWPEKGEPIELQYCGYDKSRDCQRYGFHPKSKYHDKRIFWIPLKNAPRIFTRVARNSRKWKRLYKKRTSIERINGRIDRNFRFLSTLETF